MRSRTDPYWNPNGYPIRVRRHDPDVFRAGTNANGLDSATGTMTRGSNGDHGTARDRGLG